MHKTLLQISNIKYQYGIPPESYVAEHPVSPARWSYSSGGYLSEPRIVVTRDFAPTLQNLNYKEAGTLTTELGAYLVSIGVTDNDRIYGPTSGCKIRQYDKIFSGGDSSLGRRDKGISQEDLEDKDTFVDHRLQSTDAYKARSHNLDLIRAPQWMAMVSVGILSRLTLDRLKAPR